MAFKHKTFLISDTHFGHENAYKFKNDDGTPMRPWDSAEEADEVMVDNWNKTVGEFDKVYHLGDVAISKRSIYIMGRLNGKKCLIKGNHDIFKLKDYLPYFYDIRGSHKINNFILSHIPVHPREFERWSDGNIHGHLHENVVNYPNKWSKYGNVIKDPRYYSVCVEQINYTPINFEQIVEEMK